MWSLGVIVYTLLGGYLPFNVYEDQKGSTNAELFDLILSGQFEFHEKYWREVSDDAKDFISSLLVVDPLHLESSLDLYK
jgi:serine/threonine protein kinase